MTRRPADQTGRRVARRKPTGRRGPEVVAPGDTDADAEPLTKAQVREIERRMRDLDDPTRYLLVSDLGPRFKLYYEVSDGVYVMNEPAQGTLFKRRAAAVAVKATLGPGIKLVRCKTRMRGGKRVPVLPQRARSLKGRRAGRSRRTKR